MSFWDASDSRFEEDVLSNVEKFVVKLYKVKMLTLKYLPDDIELK